MIQGIARWIVNKALTPSHVQGKTSKSWDYIQEFFSQASGIPASDLWQDWGASKLEQAATENPIVFACQKLIWTAALEAPIRVVKRKKVEGEPDELDPVDHPVLALLADPNDAQDWTEFQTALIQHFLSTGFSGFEKTRNGARIQALNSYPTSWLAVEWVKGQFKIAKFGVTFPGLMRRDILPIDFGFFMLPSAKDPRVALGPLEAAIRSVQLDFEREDYLVELLNNTPVPGPVFETGEDMSEPALKAFQRRLQDSTGKGNRGKGLVASGGGKFTFPTPLADLDWPGFEATMTARICLTHGVPGVLLGTRFGMERSIQSNLGESNRNFRLLTVVPLLTLIDRALTQNLLRDEGEDPALEIQHDLSAVKFLQDDANEQAARAGTLFDGGVVMRNEARKIAGVDPIEGDLGDAFRKPMTVEEVDADGETVGPEPEPIPDAGPPIDEETTDNAKK